MYKDQPQVDYKHKEQLLLCWFGQEGQGGQVGLDVLWVLCLWSQEQEEEQNHEFPANCKKLCRIFFRERAHCLLKATKGKFALLPESETVFVFKRKNNSICSLKQDT